MADIWGAGMPHARGTVWPARVDQHLADGVTEDQVDRWVGSACLLCSNGCGCDIAVKDGRMVGIRGRATDVVNHGRLGPKGLYGSTAWAHAPDRLTRPMIRDGGLLVDCDWETAMGRVVEVSKRLLREQGPLSHGFYTSGQLFLEEYYTLAVLGKAGVGTPHMDGNTRLCTATAAAALKESFGADGQPGSYTDIEHCDAIFLYGHNMAETQTVLWARILDRTRAADPPRLVCVDPRRTKVAEEAERTGGVHLAPRVGTNLALLNGLTRELFEHGWVDHDWVREHTLGADDLRDIVEAYTPERTAEICGVAPDDLRRAARIFGESGNVLSTVLQGFYQSHQATASAVAVNNLHLLRGLIGRPGSGILQMNGQPTAQNNRECGADGDLPGFRNWDNEQHIEQLAKLWNVDPLVIPHWAPPTHAMQIFSYAEEGSIGFLWISATNPAVSMPESARIRRILDGDQCFVVVQDLFLTETARLADVVLPAAGWGEKTGTFTNVNRTVHLSDQAVEPPGEARSDLDIFLAYAEAMDFRDRDGEPLITWRTAEEAFDAWREVTRGRPVDYTGLTYEKLRGPTGIPWPVNEHAPEGTDRLYADAVFPTATETCETYGHDLLTGGAVTEQEHRALRPDGRAFLKGAQYTPAHEMPSEDYPLLYTTGRTVYQFHTRTKTARSRSLREAAPDMWVELSPVDAERLGIAEGDIVRVESPRGAFEAQARVGQVMPGAVFAPFHYGTPGLPGEVPRQANELTMTVWDPVSKQPYFKTAACRVRKIRDGGGPAPAPTTAASAPAQPGAAPATAGGALTVSRAVPVPAYPNDPSCAAEPGSR
ncbi:molybdopterin oxidoreductase [Paractinoplanes abujensis]|uniref:Anaerobic selenocysteine-containing dehydrogenase n=1 Tax=Paractinoplanes abujensis TaxID=882441 RepID=A0A7W7CRS7_9ACTN|nr:molybdopterin oxidoreductase family protein [Actinoplanes abujensis]MBB4693539.1 anaerobic selenocysteine-containing dehydrogenase [Actinoplanes abujensis]GID21801.1 molybdopterin oxidoreductase [Actinoplanes abujensis]